MEWRDLGLADPAAAADDMVFTQYYPIIRAAKGAGEAGAGVGGEE